MRYELKLPEMGEGITGGEVVRILVSPGDEITSGQTVCELETSKALVEVPCDVTGTVEELRFAEGDSIAVGETIIILSGVSEVPDRKTEETKPSSQSPTGKQDLSAASAAPTKAPNAKSNPSIEPVMKLQGRVVPAGPATRRLARELGVDLSSVAPSHATERITKEDVKQHVRSSSGKAGSGFEPPLPDYSAWGKTEHVKPNKVKSLTAAHMSLSWSSIPHVSQFENADITELEDLRTSLDQEIRSQGARLTLTVIALKALVPLLRRFPMFNASRDPQSGEIVYKYFYNIGIATATDRGLLVPVIRSVDQKSVLDLATELSEMAARARKGKLQPDEFQGGTFSISNQGGIGGAHFTPIVNHPESAILGIGRSRIQPGYDPRDEQGTVAKRIMLPVALSYDHRIIDGAEAAAFIARFKASLEDPGKLLLGI